jgi:hypothetical protein
MLFFSEDCAQRKGEPVCLATRGLQGNSSTKKKKCYFSYNCAYLRPGLFQISLRTEILISNSRQPIGSEDLSLPAIQLRLPNSK